MATVDEPLRLEGFVPLDGISLMERAIAVSCRYLVISWERAGVLKLPVEDDISFLCDAYNELPTLCAEGGNQHVYLGDGELELTVTVSQTQALIDQRYVPFLDRRFMQDTEYSVTTDQYLAAWRRLLHGIVDMITKLEASRLNADIEIKE